MGDHANEFLMIRPPVVIAEAGSAPGPGAAVTRDVLVGTCTDGEVYVPLFSDIDLAARYLAGFARRGELKPRAAHELHQLGSWAALLEQLEWMPAAGVTSVAFDPAAEGVVVCVPLGSILRQLRERAAE
ncbi:unnamed protein product [Gemmataceae bacterium]|nr:unnamed protein product [Gemmataceae bacterium]VTU02441.1 unnamed protein product [Gemmataceae bacterium]